MYLPGVHLVNIGNEAIQLNFMQAYAEGEACPPQANIERFIQYARDLVELAQVNAVMITCSTMNRSYQQVAHALEPYGVPVIQIDMAMMERAVALGGKALVIATHGPTVASTQALLTETAERLGTAIQFDGLTLEGAWDEAGCRGYCRSQRDHRRGHPAAHPAKIIPALSWLSYRCQPLHSLSRTRSPILASRCLTAGSAALSMPVKFWKACRNN